MIISNNVLCRIKFWILLLRILPEIIGIRQYWISFSLSYSSNELRFVLAVKYIRLLI
nr:MAG TPA: hypothetical protein [Caudoviricetes sp.]